MLIQGVVGPQQMNDGIQPVTNRLDRQGGAMVSELNGRYAELAYRKQLFTAANQAATALSTLSTTCTGYALSNPVGSGVNLFLLDICVALATAPGGVANIHLAFGPFSNTAVTHTTPLTVRNCFLGQAIGAGLVDSAATLPVTPVIVRAIGGGPVATGSVTAPFIRDEVAGGLIIPPGCSVSLGYLTTAISVVASMVWAELPI